MLTAMGEAEDRIAGLERGADDYLPKPFEPRELVLRIRTILRRAAPEPAAAPLQELRLGALRFDIERRIIQRCRHEVHMTEAEASLPVPLATDPKRLVSGKQVPLSFSHGCPLTTTKTKKQ